ncbi:MAG: hypothetical protein IPO07_16780 [Haliscomenobacter sp.]|nr:SdrD B-like domain-containing protein [Haliscomenobacter sp.]MBK9490238.1 hypothetical protein [Haliscomenobacter sp.]
MTPTGGAAPYTATLTAAAAGWSSLAPGTYYVYAIYNSASGAECNPVPVQEFVVTIQDKPDVTANALTLCESATGLGATVNLANLVQNPDGASLAFYEGATLLSSTTTLSPGVHTITVVATNPALGSCQTTVPFNVEVLTYPTPRPICVGQTFTLSAPADATDVTWYRNGVAVGVGPVFTVDRPGTYTFTGTSTASGNVGCQISSCCPAVFTEGVCVSVGSTVWYDANDNGIYDQPGENPLPGVRVELYTAGGSFVGFDITDSNGDYYFGYLQPGQYYVQLPAANPALTGFISSTITNTTSGTDNNDNGAQPGGIGTVVTSETFTLTADALPTGFQEVGTGGEQDNKTVPAGFPDTNTDDDGDMTIDFGFAPAPKITHDKAFVSAVEQSNRTFVVTYKITVKNEGAASTYNLFDTPTFDADIAINSASYTRDIPALPLPGNPAPLLSTTNGAQNTLGSDVPITFGQTQTYTLTYNVTLDLIGGAAGDNKYTACGACTPGNPALRKRL